MPLLHTVWFYEFNIHPQNSFSFCVPYASSYICIQNKGFFHSSPRARAFNVNRATITSPVRVEQHIYIYISISDFKYNKHRILFFNSNRNLFWSYDVVVERIVFHPEMICSWSSTWWILCLWRMHVYSIKHIPQHIVVELTEEHQNKFDYVIVIGLWCRLLSQLLIAHTFVCELSKSHCTNMQIPLGVKLAWMMHSNRM